VLWGLSGIIWEMRRLMLVSTRFERSALARDIVSFYLEVVDMADMADEASCMLEIGKGKLEVAV
jgi:hypothetical protein